MFHLNQNFKDTRINKELVYYQTKIGIEISDRDILKGDLGDDILRLPAQLHEFDFLLPLLNAYDDKIDALETTVIRWRIANYKRLILNSSIKIKNIYLKSKRNQKRLLWIITILDHN